MAIGITGSMPEVRGPPEGMVFHRGRRPWMAEFVEEASHKY